MYIILENIIKINNNEFISIRTNNDFFNSFKLIGIIKKVIPEIESYVKNNDVCVVKYDSEKLIELFIVMLINYKIDIAIDNNIYNDRKYDSSLSTKLYFALDEFYKKIQLMRFSRENTLNSSGIISQKNYDMGNKIL